ncbi:Protein DPCD [Taenia solium]|eukprot:TsM_000730300 transcript=TsM_000730300 gene=TsM_000730300
MATSAWLSSIREAKKTILVQDDGKELVEQYDNAAGLITERKWKMPTMLGGEGQWSYEIGQGSEIDAVDFKESNVNSQGRNFPKQQAFEISLLKFR